MYRCPALVLAIVLPGAAVAQGVTIADLQGVTIQTVNTYAGTFRGEKGTAPGKVTVRGDIRIGADGAITWSNTRNVAIEGPKGIKTGSLARSGSGTIGKPAKTEDGSGNVLWVVDGNTLVQMRTLESGALLQKVTIARAGSGFSCSVERPLLREVGAGNIKDRGAISTKMEILEIRQTGSSCRVSKP